VTVSETARIALEKIPSARFWAKGVYHSGQGSERHCVLGARPWSMDRELFASAFGRVAREQFPGRCTGVDSESYVVSFNDHPDTRYADVRLILEKLAAG
jgi:hypothetical protein